MMHTKVNQQQFDRKRTELPPRLTHDVGGEGTESETERTATSDDDPPDDGDDDPYTKAYIAIDGITAGDVSDEDRETLENEVATFLLTQGYSVSGVRLLTDKVVVEADNANASAE